MPCYYLHNFISNLKIEIDLKSVMHAMKSWTRAGPLACLILISVLLDKAQALILNFFLLELYLCNCLPDDLGSSYADVFCIDLVPIQYWRHHIETSVIQ